MTLKTQYPVYTAITLLTLSFLGYFYSWVNIAGFIGFALLCLILGLLRREYALYLAFIELILGSFGYLLSIQAGGINLSLRSAFFVIIMGLYIFDIFRKKIFIHPTSILPSKEREEAIRGSILSTSLEGEMPRGQRGWRMSLVLFFLIWSAGILQGYLRGHNPADIFFDANGYLYLLMFLPAITYINTREKLLWLSKTFFASTCILAFFSLGLFIIFAKSQSAGFLEILYKWIRDFRLGEITPLKNGIYRIFLQSQIFLLPAIILVFARDLRRKISRLSFVCCGAAISSAIYISLSRSLWTGFAAGMIIFAALAIYLKIDKKVLLKRWLEAASVVAVGILLVGFFIPKDTSFLLERFQTGESAADTRMAELAPLWQAIKTSPILGYGFGKTLTFTSFDPRVGGQLYTTYAFEWGYLDMVLKFGILGLAAYLYFIWMIARKLFEGLKKEQFYNLWILSSLAALLAVHIFTPYLNHPLGIGILILGGVAANIDKKMEP